MSLSFSPSASPLTDSNSSAPATWASSWRLSPLLPNSTTERWSGAFSRYSSSSLACLYSFSSSSSLPTSPTASSSRCRRRALALGSRTDALASLVSGSRSSLCHSSALRLCGGSLVTPGSPSGRQWPSLQWPSLLRATPSSVAPPPRSISSAPEAPLHPSGASGPSLSRPCTSRPTWRRASCRCQAWASGACCSCAATGPSCATRAASASSS
mmetsp:Transcript_887/g.3270  ORF Transcript_887/g.3270 Transcript_887/m.3270 type:complete len:212 (-) Transcript_887:212-847(-)